ncbi:MAG: hypothetical protein ACI4R8_00900 [Candidatus Caccovivens sp.]
MINVVVPITEDVQNFQQFVNAHKAKNVKFYVGITETLAKSFDSSNVELHIFKDGSKKEEMINSLHSCQFQKGRIMIARRPLTDEEFASLSTSSCEIATLKAKHNRFVAFFKKLSKKIVKKIFAFEYFEDISAICYNEQMFELISVCSNLSMASRVNKYVGVEVEEIVTETKPVKKDYNRALNFLWLLLGTLFFLGSVAGGVLTCIFVPKLHALIVILVIFWIFVALIVQGIAIVNFTRTLSVGNLKYGRAQEVAIIKEKTSPQNSTKKPQNSKTKSTTQKRSVKTQRTAK